MGREYKIYKNGLWYSIYRKRNKWTLIYLEYLWSNNSWTWVKNHAKIFYNEDSAVENLVVIKARWEKDATELSFWQEKKELKQKSEKTSWSEL